MTSSQFIIDQVLSPNATRLVWEHYAPELAERLDTALRRLERYEFLEENAVSILAERDRKIEAQQKEIRRLLHQAEGLRSTIKYQARLLAEKEDK